MPPARNVIVVEPDDDVDALILRHPNGEEEEIAVLRPDEEDGQEDEGDWDHR